MPRQSEEDRLNDGYEKTNADNQSRRAAERTKFFDLMVSKLHQFNMPGVEDVLDPKTGEVLISADAVNEKLKAHAAIPKAVKPTMWPYCFSTSVWAQATVPKYGGKPGAFKTYTYRKDNAHFICFYHLKSHETFNLRIQKVGDAYYKYGDSRKFGDRYETVKRELIVETLARLVYDRDKALAAKFVETIEMGLFL